MSLNAQSLCKRNARNCPRCDEPARYYSVAKRRYRWAPDHLLCRACWQAEQDRERARQLKGFRGVPRHFQDAFLD